MTADGHFYFEAPDCQLKCLHCSHGIKKRLRESRRLHRLAGRLADRLAKLSGMDEFEKRIETSSGPVCLSGHDVLEAREIFELLDICRRHGRPIQIISPGLRLADPDFAREVNACSPEFLLTCLSCRSDLTARMTGNPEAQHLTEKALAHLRDLNANFSVNFVATSDNCGELSDVASYLFRTLGRDSFTLLYFFPDRVHYLLDARTSDRFAGFRQLNHHLRRVARDHGGSGRTICLWGVPPCKLDEELLTGGLLTFCTRGEWDPACRLFRSPSCSQCGFQDRCFFVSLYNRRAYLDEYFDYHKVNRVLSSLVY
jgi:hypothetical protein